MSLSAPSACIQLACVMNEVVWAKGSSLSNHPPKILRPGNPVPEKNKAAKLLELLGPTAFKVAYEARGREEHDVGTITVPQKWMVGPRRQTPVDPEAFFRRRPKPSAVPPRATPDILGHIRLSTPGLPGQDGSPAVRSRPAIPHGRHRGTAVPRFFHRRSTRQGPQSRLPRISTVHCRAGRAITKHVCSENTAGSDAPPTNPTAHRRRLLHLPTIRNRSETMRPQ